MIKFEIKIMLINILSFEKKTLKNKNGDNIKVDIRITLTNILSLRRIA